MTFSWSPAIKEAIESDIFAEKFADFMRNWVVTGLAPSDGGTNNLNIATGTCWIDGWRVEITAQETKALSDGSPRYVYLELSKDGAGKVTSVSVTEYASSQTEDVRILICTPTVVVGDITAVGDARQYDPIEPTLVRLKDDVSLSDWQHASDLGKIDGAEIYAGSILEAAIASGTNLTYDNVSHTITQLWGFSNTLRMNASNKISFCFTGTTEVGNLDAVDASTVAFNGANFRIGGGFYLAFGDGSDICGNIRGNVGYLQIRDDGGNVMFGFPRNGGDHTNIRHATSYRAKLSSPSNWAVLEVESNGTGGVAPSTDLSGALGGVGEKWEQMMAQYAYDADGNLQAYSERDDLGDLRAIEEWRDEHGEPYKRGEHGDPVWNCKTIPHYLKSKLELVLNEGTPKEGDGYINNSAWKGWVISLLKILDKENQDQKELIETLYRELDELRTEVQGG
jgi:hypothetical protein